MLFPERGLQRGLQAGKKNIASIRRARHSQGRQPSSRPSLRATWFHPAVITASTAHTPTTHAPHLCLQQSHRVDAITPTTEMRKLRHKVSGRVRIRIQVRIALQVLVLRMTCACRPHILFLSPNPRSPHYSRWSYVASEPRLAGVQLQLGAAPGVGNGRDAGPDSTRGTSWLGELGQIT